MSEQIEQVASELEEVLNIFNVSADLCKFIAKAIREKTRQSPINSDDPESNFDYNRMLLTLV